MPALRSEVTARSDAMYSSPATELALARLKKGLRSVYTHGPGRSRYARKKPRGETGAAPQVNCQPWMV